MSKKDRAKEIDKELLDLERDKKIEEEQKKVLERYSGSLSGEYYSVAGLILREYELKKQKIDLEENQTERLQKLTGSIEEMKEKSLKEVTRTQENGDWPDEFMWDKDGNNYLLGDDESIIFTGSQNTRRSIFEQIELKRGQWKLFSEIAHTISKKSNYVRVVVNQISKRLSGKKYKRYIKLEVRDQQGRPGACKLIAFP